MENTSLGNCPVCGSPFKVIPAGVSRTTGKPYNSFVACSQRGCPGKPAKAPAQAPAQAPRYQAAQPKENPNWDKISLGKCKYGFLLEAFKKDWILSEAEPMAEEWAKAAMRLMDSPEIKNYGNGPEATQPPF